jgi:hypothetical protein
MSFVSARVSHKEEGRGRGVLDGNGRLAVLGATRIVGWGSRSGP